MVAPGADVIAVASNRTPTYVLSRTVSRDDHIEFEGVVTEVLTAGMFKVKVAEDHEVIAHLAGKMRKFRIRVVLGDTVTVAVSPYDPTRGRITHRAR